MARGTQPGRRRGAAARCAYGAMLVSSGFVTRVSRTQVLLLDEITVDLDVVGRLRLLDFFKQVGRGNKDSNPDKKPEARGRGTRERTVG